MIAASAQEDGRPRGTLYSAIGAFLGAGAPLGYLALRSALGRRFPSSKWVAKEVSSQRAAYSYMGLSTTSVFAIFGRLLGRLEDQRRRDQRDKERLREEFSAMVSHDLRDPIARILGELDHLLEEPTDEILSVSSDKLRRVRRSVRALAQVTDDFQDVMQIELDRVVLDEKPLALPDEVAALVDELRPRLVPHPVALRVEGHPGRVLADPGRLRQILSNLLENAAKYSWERAPILIVVRPARDGAEVSVEDHGAGIAPQEMGRLFDREFQSRRARERKTGLGVGLFITRALVEAHGGKLRVESVPGSGSIFRVSLPSAPPDLAEPAEAAAAPPPVAVRRYMSAQLFTIDGDKTVGEARALMRDHRIRHLPVLERGLVVGLLSDADLAALEEREGCLPATAIVEQSMRRFPFIVSPDAPVEEVARIMGDRRYEVAIVVDQGRPVGVLGCLDALRATLGLTTPPASHA